MSKKRSKAVTVGKSDDRCKECRGELVTRKHAEITDKLRNQHYYFTQWDFCARCNKVWFDERFRVTNPRGVQYEERERQRSFLSNIT